MLKVSSSMSKNLVKIGPDDAILEAYRLMYEKGFRHLPLVDHQNLLLGILSDRDIQRAMIVDRHAPDDQEISLNSQIKVRDYMSWPVHTVQDQTSLRSVVDENVKEKSLSFFMSNTLC